MTRPDGSATAMHNVIVERDPVQLAVCTRVLPSKKKGVGLPCLTWGRVEVGAKVGEGRMFAIEAMQLARATMHFEATDG